jgi:hypothetical protein
MSAGTKLHGTAAGRKSQKRFVKRALKASGNIPTNNAVDGRRKTAGFEMRA